MSQKAYLEWAMRRSYTSFGLKGFTSFNFKEEWLEFLNQRIDNVLLAEYCNEARIELDNILSITQIQDINYQDNRCTYLEIAAAFGIGFSLEQIYSLKPDLINHNPDTGRSLIHCAAQAGNHFTLATLLELGARHDATTSDNLMPIDLINLRISNGWDMGTKCSDLLLTNAECENTMLSLLGDNTTTVAKSYSMNYSDI